ncbi:methyltransferase domain-containing protein [Kineococcus endophyticus]|uniref:Methyltransferase domain-containing protein n=1 Tax=Kineococcus endophyticus TaxID=1181883 RepID=A0ABV3P6T7_9ACTN
MLDLVDRDVQAAGRHLSLKMPRDLEALFTEEAFAHDEFVPYWAELWPSALVLADVLPTELTGRLRVLEIGAGLGVPSLCAALAGHDVTAADWAPDSVDLLRDNAVRNGATLRAERWSWTDDPAPLAPPFDVVLAADVLYERRNVAPLLAVLPALTAPGGRALVADPGRLPAPEFLEGAARTWTVDAVPHAGPAAVGVHRLTRP